MRTEVELWTYRIPAAFHRRGQRPQLKQVLRLCSLRIQASWTPWLVYDSRDFCKLNLKLLFNIFSISFCQNKKWVWVIKSQIYECVLSRCNGKIPLCPLEQNPGEAGLQRSLVQGLIALLLHMCHCSGLRRPTLWYACCIQPGVMPSLYWDLSTEFWLQDWK